MVKTLRVAVCVLLIVGVLAMSLSIFGAYEEEASDELTFQEWYSEYADKVGADDVDSAWEALGIYGIWATMNSLGISISVDGVTEWRDEIYYQMQEMLNEYLATLPSMNYLKWIVPWSFGFSETGLFQGNNTMLDDVSDFVYWLKNKYNLSDNSSSTLRAYTYIPVVNEDGIEVYIYAYADWQPVVSGWKQDVYSLYKSGFMIGSIYQLESGYYSQIRQNGNFYYIYVSAYPDMSNPVFNAALGLKVDIDATYLNPHSSNRVYSWNGSGHIPVLYQPIGDGTYDRNYYLAAYANTNKNGTGDTVFAGYAWEASGFEAYFLPHTLSTSVDSGTIVLPSDNPNYKPGDMFVVDNGDIVYLSVEFPESIAVNNLPAIITQKNIPDVGNDPENPGFSVPWQAINGLIQYVAVPAGAIMAIVNEAPVEGVIMLYALIGGIIIFGMIRVMREH